MFLYLNTSTHEKIILGLLDQKGKILKLKKISAPYQQSEKLLTEIKRLLPNYQITKLSGIIVVVGPGGFTSLRIGVATANTLAFAWQIPILGLYNPKNLSDQELLDKNFKKVLNKDRFQQVLPHYGAEPHITVKSQKTQKT
jgi:tRNA threonylcarbamoyl adenosine modification protein YeaZ